MTFIKRLMEIKEKQLGYEKFKAKILWDIDSHLIQILKVLEGRKNGKRKISRKNIVPDRIKKWGQRPNW